MRYITRCHMSDETHPPCAVDEVRLCPMDVDMVKTVKDMRAFFRVASIFGGLLTLVLSGVITWAVGIADDVAILTNMQADRGSRINTLETNQRAVMAEMASQGRSDAMQQEAINRITVELATIQNKLDRLLERQNGGK